MFWKIQILDKDKKSISKTVTVYNIKHILSFLFAGYFLNLHLQKDSRNLQDFETSLTIEGYNYIRVKATPEPTAGIFEVQIINTLEKTKYIEKIHFLIATDDLATTESNLEKYIISTLEPVSDEVKLKLSFEILAIDFIEYGIKNGIFVDRNGLTINIKATEFSLPLTVKKYPNYGIATIFYTRNYETVENLIKIYKILERSLMIPNEEKLNEMIRNKVKLLTSRIKEIMDILNI